MGKQTKLLQNIFIKHHTWPKASSVRWEASLISTTACQLVSHPLPQERWQQRCLNASVKLPKIAADIRWPQTKLNFLFTVQHDWDQMIHYTLKHDRSNKLIPKVLLLIRENNLFYWHYGHKHANKLLVSTKWVSLKWLVVLPVKIHIIIPYQLAPMLFQGI